MQSDLISRSAAMNSLSKVFGIPLDYDGNCDEMCDEAFAAIEALPVIDAVPVVRCKECTWFNHGYCISFNDDVMPDGFCSRGHTET